jgi:cytochrome o ubiquinol oxidase subunit 2
LTTGAVRGTADKAILIDSLAIMLVIVLPTIVGIFAFAYWFRASNTKAFYWPDWEYSRRIELVVWSTPALTVILFGRRCLDRLHQLDPAAPVGPSLSREPIWCGSPAFRWRW